MSDTNSECSIYQIQYNDVKYRKYPEDVYEELDLLYEKYKEDRNYIMNLEKLPIIDMFTFLNCYYNFELKSLLPIERYYIYDRADIDNLLVDLEARLNECEDNKAISIRKVINIVCKERDMLKKSPADKKIYNQLLKIVNDCNNISEKLETYREYDKIINDFDELKNKIVLEHPFYLEQKKELDRLRKKIEEQDKNNQIDELEIKNISSTSSFPDYYTIHLFSETEEEKHIRINKDRDEKLKIFNKKIIKSKFMSVCKYAYINKDNIIKEKKEKENKLRKKMELNIIKSKTKVILKELFNDSGPFLKLVEKVKKYKNIIFENINIHKAAINIDRSMMIFLSDLYDEKENKKTLSNKDFMLAVNEFHSDKNSTRMNHLCKIMYNLRKNDIIWNSNIIFKHIYSFQYIKDYQIKYLLHYIETIILT